MRVLPIWQGQHLVAQNLKTETNERSLTYLPTGPTTPTTVRRAANSWGPESSSSGKELVFATNKQTVVCFLIPLPFTKF